ncbi:MAG: hypothetical protein H0T66_09205 [Geodermatophilaceae bacterium]|nr:hypothetical protein [Geodermatophilaceae bacterium]
MPWQSKSAEEGSPAALAGLRVAGAGANAVWTREPAVAMGTPLPELIPNSHISPSTSLSTSYLIRSVALSGSTVSFQSDAALHAPWAWPRLVEG